MQFISHLSQCFFSEITTLVVADKQLVKYILVRIYVARVWHQEEESNAPNQVMTPDYLKPNTVVSVTA